MIIERVPKEQTSPGYGHDKTTVIMTRDEAVDLVAGLVKFLYERPERHSGFCPGFPEGLWGGNRIVFAVVTEERYTNHLQQLRAEEADKDEQ